MTTKHGPVRTDHVLFIAAGAFHVSKPSDLIPELQGRLPIRVELESLTEEDFVRILVEPENALTKQYTALLATEGVTVEFPPDGVREIARIATVVNGEHEDIGARRLHTILEKGDGGDLLRRARGALAHRHRRRLCSRPPRRYSRRPRPEPVRSVGERLIHRRRSRRARRSG